MSEKLQSVLLDLRTSMPAMNRVMVMHRMARARWYRVIHQEVGWLLRATKQIPPEPWTRVQIKATRYAPRMLDFDGLAASIKAAVDGMVRSGVMVDDSWKVTGPWILDQQKVPGTHARVVIIVTPVIDSTRSTLDGNTDPIQTATDGSHQRKGRTRKGVSPAPGADP